jgi:dipeptidyl aminopeptidase/acylaminoacyl peptidase
MRFAFVMLAAVAASFAAPRAQAAAPAERIAVEAFGALPGYHSPSLSPDGRRVLAIGRIGDERALMVYDLDGDGSRFTRIALGELDLLAARWAGNRRLLLSVAGMNKVYGSELPMTRVFLYDFDKGELEPLGGAKFGGLNGGDIVFVDPAGRFALIAAQRTIFDSPTVFRVDLDKRKVKEAVRGQDGVWNWFADENGIVRAGLGVAVGSWSLYYREKEDGPFRRIAGLRPGEHDVSSIDTLVPIAGTDQGYVIANKGTGRYGIYRFDFAKDEIGEAIYEHPGVDVEELVYSRSTGAPEAITFVDDRDRIVWLDKKMGAVQTKVDKALPGRVNRIVSRDEADERMIVLSQSASDPGLYYLYDRTKGQLTELARPNPALEGKPLAPVEAVSYKARDGLTIPAYLTRPVGRGEKNLPLIIMPHGGPFLRDKWEYSDWAQFLANRGYLVLQPNYRGSTGYGKAFVDAATGQWGRKMQDDLDDGVRWLVERGLADPKRVCILGASYGGYAAMWAAARNPDVYRCAVSFAGVSEMRTLLRYDAGGWVARRYYLDWRDRVRGDSKFDLDRVSPLSHAGDIRIPILLAHGKKDPVVPYAQTERLHDALRAAKRDHDYVLYPEAKHGFTTSADSIDFLRRVEAFLAKNNPAG